MARFELTTDIQAPPDLCFDLSRDLDMHLRSMAHTGEEIVGGRASGLIELGESVTWRAKHFWVFHTQSSKITAFDKPHHFRDEMVEGRFKFFRHDHYYEPIDGGTRMRDTIEFASPFGPIGWLVDVLILKRYLTKLIDVRNMAIKREAEAGTQGQSPQLSVQS